MDIKIKTTLWENNDIEMPYVSNIIGELNDEVITYQDDIVKVAIIKKSDKITFIRETDEYKITLNFNDNNSTYLLKEDNRIVDLNLITKKLVIKDNSIYVKYDIEGNVITFIIEYEVL